MTKDREVDDINEYAKYYTDATLGALAESYPQRKGMSQRQREEFMDQVGEVFTEDYIKECGRDRRSCHVW